MNPSVPTRRASDRPRRGVAHAHALDPARVGRQHLEGEPAGRRLDQLAAIGHPAGEREQQAAEGVDVLLAFVFGKHRADTLLELLDGGARIGNAAAIRPLDQLRADRDVVDRKSVVSGKRVSVSVAPGCRRTIKKNILLLYPTQTIHYKLPPHPTPRLITQ